MKRAGLIVGLVLFVAASATCATYLVSRQRFIRDFNAGVRAYLTGNFSLAQDHLSRALARRSGNAEVRRLLLKSYMEDAFAKSRQGDRAGAQVLLKKAMAETGTDAASREAVRLVQSRLDQDSGEKPQTVEQVLAQISKEAQGRSMSEEWRLIFKEWTDALHDNQRQMLERFWNSQDEWMGRIETERRSFQKSLVFSLIFLGVMGAALVGALVFVLNAYLGRRGVMVRLLEDHYHRMVAALPVGSIPLMGPPPSQAVSDGTRRIQAIEAELVETRDPEAAKRMLREFFEGEDPWVRARAAKVLYAFDSNVALQELRQLVREGAIDRQWPGIWALSDIATPESIELLQPLIRSSQKEVQQAAIRSLVQMQSRPGLSDSARLTAQRLLDEAREYTGWII